MKRIVLTYGGIAAAIVVASMGVGTLLTSSSAGEAPSYSVWLGFLFMIVALSVIFLAIKRYRDRELGGVIRFSTAFLVGLGISVLAGLVYVLAWEASLAITDYAFAEDYASSVIASKRAQGVDGAELEAAIVEMAEFKENYAKPLVRLPMTFLEIFPVGLLITLISALVLRKSEVLPATG